MNAILIHGTCDKTEYFNPRRPSLSNSHWFPWVQKQLLMEGIITQTPEIPLAYDPQYDLWKKEIERYNVDTQTVLVGHSCGGGFLVRFLSESKVSIKKLILVAPWIDPHRKKTTNFFDFRMDPHLSKRVDTHLFYSTDDMESIQLSVGEIIDTIPGIVIHESQNKGHFTYGDMKTGEFPELVSTILS